MEIKQVHSAVFYDALLRLIATPYIFDMNMLEEMLRDLELTDEEGIAEKDLLDAVYNYVELKRHDMSPVV